MRKLRNNHTKLNTRYVDDPWGRVTVLFLKEGMHSTSHMLANTE